MVPPPQVSMPPSARALFYQQRHPLLQYLPNHLLYPELASLRTTAPNTTPVSRPPVASLSSHHHTPNQPSVARLKSPPPPPLPNPALMDTGPLHNLHQHPSAAAAVLKRPSPRADTPTISKPPAKRSRFPQPQLPSDSQLGCRDFFDAKDQDVRVLFAMMLGVDPTATTGLPHFDPDRPPFSKKVRPTNIILAEELLRRAKQANDGNNKDSNSTKPLPRPSQWDKEKIIAALQHQYPPRLSHDDLHFLRDECHTAYQIALRKEWNDDATWFRMYHAMVVLRDNFRTRNRRRTAGSDDFWHQLVVQFMKSDWVPVSLLFPDFGLEKSLPLKLTLKEPPTPNELARRFKDVKKKLQELVPKQIHAQQRFKYPDVPLHYFYLSELAKQNGMLESCIVNVGDRREGDKPSLSEFSNEENEVAEEQPSGVGYCDELVMVEPSTTAATACAANVEDADTQFLKSQYLYLEQLELYNTVENEWQSLEEKCLEAQDGELKDLYKEFAKRKQSSLAVIQDQLEVIGKFCDSQRKQQS